MGRYGWLFAFLIVCGLMAGAGVLNAERKLAHKAAIARHEARTLAIMYQSRAARYTSETKAGISAAEDQLKLFKANHGQFPTGDDEVLADLLVAKVRAPGGRMEQPYLEWPAVDGHSRPLHYQWPNKKDPKAVMPAIWSDGLNGVNEGGAGDDVANW